MTSHDQTPSLIKDIRNHRGQLQYLSNLSQIKRRLEHIEATWTGSFDNFQTEALSLQIRMIVELISFGLLALHEQTYRQFRALENKSAEDDWNSREITNLISKINPSLTFIPIDPDFQLMPDGSKHHQDRPRKETYRLDNLNKLYARCGRILHVPNHLKKSTTVETFHAEIPSIVKKLRLSLQDHVVLTNHDSEQEATALIFSLGLPSEKPRCVNAQSKGNFYLGK
jgi:hypothetical protein